MGDGRQITPLHGNQAPRAPGEGRPANDRPAAPGENAEPRNNKANAPQLLDREWRNNQAAGLRNNLSAQMSRGERTANGAGNAHGRGNEVSTNAARGTENAPNGHRAGNGASANHRHGGNDAPLNVRREVNNALANARQDINSAANNARHAVNNAPVNLPNGKNVAPENSSLNRNILSENLRQTTNERQISPNSFAARPIDRAQNLLNQTWESLIARAREHKDLAQFRAEPKQFWNDVRRMSEVRVVETFVNGKMEPRAVSRYGELLDGFNRQGGRLENFLASLPPRERAVFQARYQINQIFGATDLFVGRGVALDKSGQFSARVFLAGNGKNPELSPHAVLSLLNSEPPDGAPRVAMNTGVFSAGELALLENFFVRADGEIMFSAKSAALLSLSLALYQNVDATLSLHDLAAEFFMAAPSSVLSPKIPDAAPDKASRSAFENGNVNEGAPGADDQLAIGALISGALATVEGYRKTRSRGILPGIGDSSSAGFGFAAGATGAVMGATVGCVVPLAEKRVAEIIAFAAGVVTGLTDGGLRALGANTLISAVAGGVQTLLNASSADQQSLAASSPNKFLSAADLFKDDLDQRLFSSRITTLLPS